MPTYTIDQYAAINNWAAIDALGSRARAKGVALQREKLRDECTLRDVNDEVIPFVAFKRELVEGKLVAAAAIVDERRDDAGGMQCLVKWLDSAEENTWVPETNCNEALLNAWRCAKSGGGGGGGGGGVWVPDRRAVLRNEMKQAVSLTGVGGVSAVLVKWGVATIVAH